MAMFALPLRCICMASSEIGVLRGMRKIRWTKERGELFEKRFFVCFLHNLQR